MVSAVIGHWKASDQSWTTTQIHQRKESGKFFTEGRDIQEKTQVFHVDQHTATGSLFPQERLITSVMQNCVYTVSALIHKPITATGNLAFTVVDTARAVWNNAKGNATLGEGLKPVKTRLKQAVKDAVVIGLPTALYQYNATYLKYLGMGVAGLVGAYSLFNPKGAKYQISRLEGRINPAALNDHEASKLRFKDRAFAVLDGSYSLSRMLRMHCMGTTSDQVGSQNKFEFVDKKED